MGKTILIIDDDVTNTNLLRMFMQMEGFSVETATDLEQGLAKLQPPIDAILVDYHLPQNTSGLTIIETVRSGKSELDDQTPIVIASGDDRIEGEVTDAGGDRFLLKPFSPTDLATLLKSMLGES